jgi:multiple sugar transport system ATP-binding protein
MANVSISGLQKSYGGVDALRGIDLEIPDGEFTVLVGPSGCGKSTLLRSIAGLEEITGGTIAIGDQVVNDMRPRDRDVAMVFQDYALYPHMTVFNNIGFALRARKLPDAEIDSRVKTAARMLDIDSILNSCSSATPGSFREASVSVSRLAAPSCAIHGFFFSTSLSAISTRNCAMKCEARLNACIRNSAQP